ncbi:MAG: thiamine ABC transporter substrate-binding protein [Anaerolineae bacterium]
MKRILSCIFLILAFSGLTIAQETPVTLKLLTHDSFAVSEDVLNAFQTSTGITVEVVRSGDAGIMVNQSILSKDTPLGDVMFGVDNTFLSRALDAGIFDAYTSPAVSEIPDRFKLDDENRVTPVDYGDVCLNYDVAYFSQHAIPLPATLADLTKPEYKSLLVVENPATSSPGLAFVLLSISAFGTEGDYTYLDYWKELVANDVYIADDWSNAYYTQFSGSIGSEGTRPLVVSYASSPPAEVYFADPQPETAPTGSITTDGMCFRQIEFAGILKGTSQPEAARDFIDFLLSKTFQEDMPLQMFVFPVLPKAQLPEVFAKFAAVPAKPVVVAPSDIDTNREEWLQLWMETVLR